MFYRIINTSMKFSKIWQFFLREGKWSFMRFFGYNLNIFRLLQPPEVFCKKGILEILQNSQENTCARVSFVIKLQALEQLWWLLLNLANSLFKAKLLNFKQVFDFKTYCRKQGNTFEVKHIYNRSNNFAWCNILTYIYTAQCKK